MRSYVISQRSLWIFLLSLLAVLSACGQGSTSATTTPPTAISTSATIQPLTVDTNGTPIVFPSSAPHRIVSMVPSVSEILGALSLQDTVVGVDSFTDYPASLTKLPKVSTNGKYSIEQILLLKPDLVLSYGGDTKQYDLQLQNQGLKVVDLPSANFSQILQEIVTVGRLTGTEATAQKLVAQLQQQINQVKAAVAGASAPKTLIELDDSAPGKPYVFGGGSFGDDLLKIADAQNIFATDTSGGGFPQVTDEAVISANPQYIFLTEDLAYGGDAAAVYKRANWGTIDAVKAQHVYHLNGSLVGRPGPRLVQGLRCLAQLVHPDKFTGTLPAYCTAA